MADRIQLRRDTAANWTAYNPILLEGEPGIELDTDQWKMGDGVHTWSQLAYRGGECVQQKGQSTTVAMSQKAVTDCFNKKEAIESDDFHFENTSETDIHTQNLIYGKCISILVSEYNGSTAGALHVYGATATTGGWIEIGVAVVGSELVVSLDRNYNFVRIGGGSVIQSLSGSYSIYDSYIANRAEQVEKNKNIINNRLLPDSEVVHRDLDFSVQISDGTSSGDIAVCADASKLRQDNVIKVENLSGSGTIEVYAYRADNTYYGYGGVSQGSSRNITLLENYVRIKAYSSQVHHVRMTLLEPGVISEAVKELTANNTTLNNRVDGLEDINLRYQEETGTAGERSYPQYNTTTIQIKDGERFKFESGYQENYIMWNDGSFTSISDGMTYVMEYPAGKTYSNIRVLTGQAGAEVTVKVTFIPEVFEDTIKDINKANGGITLPIIRALILGDSYSAGGGSWVYPMLSKLPIGSSYISLAVSSASLKDHYADRETYPYTDRPVSTDNAGNHNTLACQIQKLKRLMEGTDLDAGESPIYQTPESYPNVIIIAGGKNDGYDSDAKVATYHAQLNKVVNNVYRKRYFSDENPELGSVTIKTPIEEVDRTCFAGAYRYLMDELLELFPNAHIYFATVSPISYRSGGDVSVSSLKITNQQRLCADIFGASLIDWYRDGQINSVANYAQGSGTEDDPYIWGQCTLPNADTYDQLHPNARGGKKYGICAAHAIINTFIEIE